MERESDTSLTSSLVRHGTVRGEEERDQHADEEQRRDVEKGYVKEVVVSTEEM